MPLRVVAETGKRRAEPGCDIAFGRAVFVPGAGDITHPVFAENPFIQPIGAVLFDGEQPHQLKIKIVIRCWPAGGFLCIKADIAKLPGAFHRGAKCAADIFPLPAAEDFVPEFMNIDPGGGRYFQYGHDCFSFCTVFSDRNGLIFFCSPPIIILDNEFQTNVKLSCYL